MQGVKMPEHPALGQRDQVVADERADGVMIRRLVQVRHDPRQA
jgi:hypothetical protein